LQKQILILKIKKIMFKNVLKYLKQNLNLFTILFLIALISSPFLINYPMGFDGAYNLQIPKNINLHGQYATNIAPFDVLITTGFPVLGIITMFFLFFGISFISAKIAMFLFFLLLIYAIYLIVNNSFNSRKLSIAAILFFFFLYMFKIPGAFTYIFEVIGEIPCFAFFILSLFFISNYFKSQNNYLPLILSGIFLGLAIETKIIMLLSIPSIMPIFFAYWNRNNNIKFIKNILIFLGALLIPFVFFFTLQITQLGFSGFIKNNSDAIQFIKNNSGSGVQKNVSRFDYFQKHITVTTNDLHISNFEWLFILLIVVFLFYRFTIKKNYTLLSIIIFFTTYSTWWFFFNGSFWTRHYIPGFLSLLILFSFTFVEICRFLETKKYNLSFSLIAILILSINIAATTTFINNIDLNSLKKKSLMEKEVTSFIKNNLNKSDIYYRGWWQVPEISFYFRKPFFNIDTEKLNNNKKNILILTKLQKTLAPESYPMDNLLCDKVIFSNDEYQICKIKKDIKK
jgi:hypothetical protein